MISPDRYREVRSSTLRLVRPLSAEDCAIQSMEDASPAKWHLAHTTWFFETFVLERVVPEFRPFDDSFRVLFNSYYNSVGEQHPRPRRGMLSRPSLETVVAYRASVDDQIEELLERGPDAETARVVEIGLHHEQQHQELLLTDVKHMLSCNPLRPAYDARIKPQLGRSGAFEWHRYEEGLREIGHGGGGFAFDNETPNHRAFLNAFELASRPATNGEFIAFMEDGGYERPELWLSDGWALAQREGWRAPLYWKRRDEDGAWTLLSLAGPWEVDPEAPVTHLSFYEADAFASWSGARLPSEAEWEVAAREVPVEGNFVESGLLHPVPGPAPGARPPGAPGQLFGDVWEWTASAYAPYPGYVAPPGALGEYNGKFMCSQLVLRGGSCATPRSHLRPTYRNFFYPHQRWQFSGVRLARDAG